MSENSINKVWREQKGTHVVIALEGPSWRKDFMNLTNVTLSTAQNRT